MFATNVNAMAIRRCATREVVSALVAVITQKAISANDARQALKAIRSMAACAVPKSKCALAALDPKPPKRRVASRANASATPQAIAATAACQDTLAFLEVTSMAVFPATAIIERHCARAQATTMSKLQ